MGITFQTLNGNFTFIFGQIRKQHLQGNLSVQHLKWAYFSCRTSNDKTELDNKVSFNTEILRKAELELSGVSTEQQVRFGGEIKGESAMVSIRHMVMFVLATICLFVEI